MCVGCMWSWGKETKWVRSDVHTGALLFPVGCCLPAASILSLHLFSHFFLPSVMKYFLLNFEGIGVCGGEGHRCSLAGMKHVCVQRGLVSG